LSNFLDKHLANFFRSAGVEYNESILDKAKEGTQFKAKWRDAGVPYEHGVAIYLLTYVEPYSTEVRVTPQGWVAPEDWVVKNYFGRFKGKLLPVGEFKVCFVCGRVRTTHKSISSRLAKCTESRECNLRSIIGIDKLYIDADYLPQEGMTDEWKRTLTKRQIPFIAVDCSNTKGKIVMMDPKLPIPEIYTHMDKLEQFSGSKTIAKPGGIEEMTNMLMHGEYTLEELAKENNLALNTVKTQVLYRLKDKYEMDKKVKNGKEYYTILT